ncbi:hypothetical protein Poly51_09420 [Rubripirellula tenax]|uniref:Uncharacterized protein n=1 Tax=Rubripirellula tenax TaxID=2528015 RepID=A0A5C6FMD7_9BACT|nr:hypothetical protein Poly51_09420 [Rubripirellula tenax]
MLTNAQIANDTFVRPATPTAASWLDHNKHFASALINRQRISSKPTPITQTNIEQAGKETYIGPKRGNWILDRGTLRIVANADRRDAQDTLLHQSNQSIDRHLCQLRFGRKQQSAVSKTDRIGQTHSRS